MGFTVSRPVQKKTIPLAMAGRDVLACAVTTRGKTAACLLPILDRFFAFTRTRRRADRLAGFLARRGVPNLREDYIYRVGRTALPTPRGPPTPSSRRARNRASARCLVPGAHGQLTRMTP